jgi:hypothetical protein
MMRHLTELFLALFDNDFAQTALPAISPTLEIVHEDVVQAFLIRSPSFASKFDNPMTPDIGRLGARVGIGLNYPLLQAKYACFHCLLNINQANPA